MFSLQQAAEKYLKAFLVKQGYSVPKTHNLYYLLSLCQRVEKKFERLEDDIGFLSEYAVESRYPGDPPIIYSESEAKLALLKAKKIVNLVKISLG